MNSADKCQGFPESCKISFRRILLKSGNEIERRVIASFQVAEAWASGATFVNGRTFCSWRIMVCFK